ncbi:hypothetical protein BKA93DRAFT_375721 [Sparassis latifolia]
MATVLCETISVHPPLFDETYTQSRFERRTLHAIGSSSRLTTEEKSSITCNERTLTARCNCQIGTSPVDSSAKPSYSQIVDSARSFSVPAVEVEAVRRVRSAHWRAKSDASPRHAGAWARSAIAQKGRRERVYPSADRPRCLASSFIVSHPRVAPPILHTASNAQTPGSFTPTGSPREALLSVLAEANPFSSRLSSRARQLYVVTDTSALHEDDTSQLPHNSPSPSPDSPTIPSICRTPSSYTGSDYFPTAPSSAGPPTPMRSAFPSPPKGKLKTLNPVLESLEQASKFRTRTCCATCNRAGTNFPCCPRCGDMWCSRACRLQGSGGKKHVCAK